MIDGSIYGTNIEVQRCTYWEINKTKIRTKASGVWSKWIDYITNSDLAIDSTSLIFTNGASIVNGTINATNYRAAIVMQKYRDTVKNVTLTAQLTASSYVIYARNANDGSNYNGNLDVYIIAGK